MSRIKTYEDLEAEEKRLQALLYSHRESLKDSAVSFKASLNPFKMAIGTVGKLFHRDKSASPLASFGLYMGVDVLVRRFLLAKSGWFTKIIASYKAKKGRRRYKQNKKLFYRYEKRRKSKSAKCKRGY
jgi:hypothetical protein